MLKEWRALVLGRLLINSTIYVYIYSIIIKNQRGRKGDRDSDSVEESNNNNNAGNKEARLKMSFRKV